jgi:hypothetical protein
MSEHDKDQEPQDKDQESKAYRFGVYLGRTVGVSSIVGFFFTLVSIILTRFDFDPIKFLASLVDAAWKLSLTIGFGALLGALIAAFLLVRGRGEESASKLPSDIVSENYFSENGRLWLMAGGGICLFGFIAVAMSDLAASALCFVLGVATLSHYLLTKLRVERGFFGSNASEALELISFITDHANRTGLPPGSRPSRPYDLSDRTKTATDLETSRGQVRTR